MKSFRSTASSSQIFPTKQVSFFVKKDNVLDSTGYHVPISICLLEVGSLRVLELLQPQVVAAKPVERQEEGLMGRLEIPMER